MSSNQKDTANDTSGNTSSSNTSSSNTSSSSNATDAQPSGLQYFTEAFPNAPNPSNPNGDVIIDGAGNMFGTTQAGGTTNQGSVFEATVNPTGGFEQPVALTSFTSYPSPLTSSLQLGNLVEDSSGRHRREDPPSTARDRSSSWPRTRIPRPVMRRIRKCLPRSREALPTDRRT